MPDGNGWLDQDDNVLGLQGLWYTFRDDFSNRLRLSVGVFVSKKSTHSFGSGTNRPTNRLHTLRSEDKTGHTQFSQLNLSARRSTRPNHPTSPLLTNPMSDTPVTEKPTHLARFFSFTTHTIDPFLTADKYEIT